MKRREFLTKLGALGLVGLTPVFAGCIGAGPGNVASGTASGTATASGSLARTCPRGRACTAPQCQLWSDLDKDNRCDRGDF